MRKISNIKLDFRKEVVFHIIDCYPDSNVYQQVEEEYEQMREEALRKVKAEAVLEAGVISREAAGQEAAEGDEALFLIVTIGRELSDWSTELFQKGDYLAGMLADAMADDCLMQAADSVKEAVMEECKIRGLGILKRLEAPTNIKMEAQKLAYDITEASSSLGIGIMSSYMYDPVKTLCQVFLLGEGCGESWIEHNCRECKAVNCKLRKQEETVLEVIQGEDIQHITCGFGQSAMEALREAALYLPALCAGRGTCGKCRIKVVKGIQTPSRWDIETFTPEELEEGWRLACKTYPLVPLTIQMTEGIDDRMEILGEDEHRGGNEDKACRGEAFLAIDIGTTTIAMCLTDKLTGEVIESYTAINRQRSFGADVISRIEAAGKGEGETLRQCICEDIWQGISRLTEGREEGFPVSGAVIAANTTMIHLLMGYPCESLGVFPFTPYETGTINTTFGEIFREIPGMGAFGAAAEAWMNVDVTIMPGISAFVGGDIVSGLLLCLKKEAGERIPLSADRQMPEGSGCFLLIDLGTNGEMAVGNGERLLVTSTAAGPAFEGGNIICGTGSIPGAVSRVNIDQGKPEISTIAGKLPPVGICGTGVMEALYELWKNELIDETGLLAEDYFETGFLLGTGTDGREIRIYQKDVRELQLAKAAVRAGIETLLLRFGIEAGQLGKVYVAGGFGVSLDMEKAAAVGLLPDELLGKIESIGNSSLKGAILYGVEEASREKVEKIRGIASEINLSNDVYFNELYMSSMFFE